MIVQQQDDNASAKPNLKVTIITAVAKQSAVEQPASKKGELMESNMDAMEVRAPNFKMLLMLKLSFAECNIFDDLRANGIYLNQQKYGVHLTFMFSYSHKFF